MVDNLLCGWYLSTNGLPNTTEVSTTVLTPASAMFREDFSNSLDSLVFWYRL